MIADKVGEFADMVKAAGIDRVVQNLEDVNPPCAWLPVDVLDIATLSGDPSITVAVHLVGSHVEQSRALAELEPMLAKLHAAGIYPDPDQPIQFVGVRPTTQQRALPALRIPVTFH